MEEAFPVESTSMSDSNPNNPVPFSSIEMIHTFPVINNPENSQFSLEEIFTLFFSQNSLFFQNYHQKALHFNYQVTQSWRILLNNSKFSRMTSYGFIADGEERFCDEEHEIRLEKDEKTDIWLYLHLLVKTIVYENVRKENILKNIDWGMVWTIGVESLQVQFSCEMVRDEMVNQVCKISVMVGEITEMLPVLQQIDDSSDDWFQLVSCSTSVLSEESKERQVSGDIKAFTQNLIEQNVSKVEITPPEEIGSNENSILESLSGDTPPTDRIPSRKHECIFFSIKLGINFRIQNNTILIGSFDFSENADDFSSIHSLDMTCIESIYGNAVIEDSTYVRGLNHTLDRRPSRITMVLRKQPDFTHVFVPNEMTRESASQERFWRIGVDNNHPTYKISAAPVKRTSSIVHSHSDFSNSNGPVTTTAQFAAPIACDASDPRSPGSRTPIVTATVVASRPLENENPFHGILNTTNYPAEAGPRELDSSAINLASDINAEAMSISPPEEILPQNNDISYRQNYKVLLSCPLIFGEEKKTWKVDILVPVESSNQAETLQNIWAQSYGEFCDNLVKKFDLPFPYLESSEEDYNYQLIEITGRKLLSELSDKDIQIRKKISITFFDAELDEVVLLDGENFVDFISQKKKSLTVKYDKEVKVERILRQEVVKTTQILNDQSDNSPETIATEWRINSNLEDVAISDTASQGATDLTYIEDNTVWKWIAKEDMTVPSIGSALISVNGIRMKGLDRNHILAILKQRLRPLFLEFETASATSPRIEEVSCPQISAATFLAKYSHPSAKNLRKQVAQALSNYVDCDWQEVTSVSASPQLYVASLYRSIEGEFESLGLFDSATPQGGGIPKMDEPQWMDVRSHIETLVFNQIFEKTWAMAPSGDSCNLVEPASQFRPRERHVSLHKKLAYQRFLTLRDLGINIDQHLSDPCLYYPYLHNLFSAHSSLFMPDEWRFALKELSRACEMKSPLKIMQKLKASVTLATHGLNSMLTYPERYNFESTKNFMERTKFVERYTQSVLIRENTDHERSTPIGADDLMPLVSWLIIQANPPDLEKAVWLCSEFRHHAHLMGEYAYALTQISSALEFCKESVWSSFVDISEEAYLRHLKEFEYTQDLIEACRVGDSNAVIDLLTKGADINGYNVDQSETPLSAAIKCRNIFILNILLKQPNVNVDIRLSPYHAPKEFDEFKLPFPSGNMNNLRDATPLMLTAMMGSVEMTLMLLEKGANRYLLNENGDSAASLAYAAGYREVVRILFADPFNYHVHYANLIRNEDIFLIRGLLSQPYVNINEIFVIDSLLNDASPCGPIIGSLLMAGVHRRKLDIVNLILTSESCDVNLSNPFSETALMWCGKDSFPHAAAPGVDEDEVRMDIALSLLRKGADRSLMDSRGWTAFHWAIHGSRTRGLSDALGTRLTFTADSENIPPITTQIQAAKYPKLAAVLHYDPKKYHIWDVARTMELYGVFALLEQGVSINSFHPDLHFTPLIAAVYNQDIDMIELLVKYPSLNINQPGEKKNTALHYAAQTNSVQIVGLLLRHGADRNLKNTENLTPLDYALGKGDTEIINCLKYDPKKVSICLAAKHGDLNVFVALMNQGVSVNAKLKHITDKGTSHELTTPLIAAVHYEQTDFLRKILDPDITRQWPEKVDINGTNFLGQTALMCAVQIKNESLVLYLLKKGASRYIKDIEGNTAADWAEHYQLSSIHMILQCDPEQSSVHAAIRDGNIEATKAFFKQNPDPNMRWFSSQPYARGTQHLTGTNLKLSSTREILDGEPPMIVAAKFNCIPVITLLLKAPSVDIDIVDTFGKTPLMHAAENGYEECVLYLLKQRANRNALDYIQKKALNYALENRYESIAAILEADPYKVHIHDACEEGKVNLVIALMKQGCPINYRDERIGKHSRTPLMAACAKGQLEVGPQMIFARTYHPSSHVMQVVNHLLGVPGIDINAQDSDGMTALMHAARIGSLEITGRLLSCGCNRTLVDKKGKTAESHASDHGYVTYLQFKGQNFVR